MTFAGLNPGGSERADVIDYLNSKSDKPAELPKQAAQAPAAEKQAAAPAGGDAKPAPAAAAPVPH